MKAIDGKARTISEILKGKRYGIDYYQREYQWKRKQVKELVEDLTDQFLQSHRPGNPRSAVVNYGNYFLGSIILSERDGRQFIVDGQQRLTTITLLLLLLHRKQGSRPDRVHLEELIYSEKFGERAFNIAVEDRRAIMSALFNGEVPDTSEASVAAAARPSRKVGRVAFGVDQSVVSHHAGTGDPRSGDCADQRGRP